MAARLGRPEVEIACQDLQPNHAHRDHEVFYASEPEELTLSFQPLKGNASRPSEVHGSANPPRLAAQRSHKRIKWSQCWLMSENEISNRIGGRTPHTLDEGGNDRTEPGDAVVRGAPQHANRRRPLLHEREPPGINGTIADDKPDIGSTE